MIFERGRDRRLNDVGRCAGIIGDDLNGGKLHGRQGGDGQHPIANEADEHDGDDQQGRRDRAYDERGRNIHSELNVSGRSPGSSGTISTRLPDRR